MTHIAERIVYVVMSCADLNVSVVCSITKCQHLTLATGPGKIAIICVAIEPDVHDICATEASFT